MSKSMSGIEMTEECIELFKDMKITTKGADRPRFKYAIFKLSDDNTKVELEEKVEAKCLANNREEDEEIFEELKGKLSKKEPRFILYDMRFCSKSGSLKEILTFIKWCSDEAPIKKKMLAGSTWEYLKKKFDGLKKYFEASEICEMCYNEFADVVER
ncbi:cofilin [Nematostella vectensis]|uniref:cofilin n=1 Tax=Nematostella vectensis TaxID=45351 RepID=UPI0020774D98|nr:cofilin [Nematostella vectensis]